MNENEVMELMNNINYGWIDKNHNKHINDYETFASDYILQSPEEVIQSSLGVCWDQVELERYYFKDNINTYFIVNYDNNENPTHTFLTYQKDNKYYWFEHSFELYRGIHEYNSLNELLLDVKNKFISFNKIDEDNISIYEYTKPSYGITCEEFYQHATSGKEINI